MKKIFVLIFLFFIMLLASLAYCSDIAGLEREALILRSEFNRLGSSGDPLEREAILHKIIGKCKGTEEAEAAYWDLADLYLDGFEEEKRKEACETLELCLKNYPNTNRSLLVKCRLVDLYDVKNSRRAELIRQLKNENALPSIILSRLN